VTFSPFATFSPSQTFSSSSTLNITVESTETPTAEPGLSAVEIAGVVIGAAGGTAAAAGSAYGIYAVSRGGTSGVSGAKGIDDKGPDVPSGGAGKDSTSSSDSDDSSSDESEDDSEDDSEDEEEKEKKREEKKKKKLEKEQGEAKVGGQQADQGTGVAGAAAGYDPPPSEYNLGGYQQPTAESVPISIGMTREGMPVGLPQPDAGAASNSNQVGSPSDDENSLEIDEREPLGQT
jgi:hypothetical protein